MRKPWVLRVLGTLATADDASRVAARIAAYRRTPWPLRGLVRATVQRAVATASHETNVASDEAHVHRLAYLTAVGLPLESPDDVEATRVAFEEARRAHASKERVGLRTMAWPALALASVGVASWLALRDPYAGLVDDAGPETVEAYARGGRPLAGSASTRALFEGTLPRFVIALDHDRLEREQGARTTRSATLIQAAEELIVEARAALGPELARQLATVVELSMALVGAVDVGVDVAFAQHAAALAALAEGLEAAGLGYFVDAEVLRAERGVPRVLMSTFTVEHVRVYRAGAASGATRTVRALRLRRLDHLAFERTVLGYTRRATRDAIVLDGPIEEHLVTEVFPALVEGAPFALDPSHVASPALQTAEARVGVALRGEVGRVLGDERGAAVGALFVRRSELVDGLARELAGRVRFARPDTYALDLEGYAAIEAQIPRATWHELESVEDALREREHQAPFAIVRGLVRDSVERHEAQHRLDFDEGLVDQAPAPIESLLGPVHLGPYDDPLAARATAELSAYLAQLARSPLARTELALLVRHLYAQLASPESYVALVIVEALADALGEPHAPLWRMRGVDRDELSRLLTALVAHDTDAVATAARTAWTRLFGRPLPDLTPVD